MDFIDELRSLSNRAAGMHGVLETEEATKTALILPFIRILGYDIFNPTEVIPEYTADVGIKKGEKVDYAIVRDGEMIMIFECKHSAGSLNVSHASQLYRYFSVTDAKIAVLTNGMNYSFYTDLEAQNRMDTKPFLEIDLLDLQESSVRELKKLTRQSFDVTELLDRAGELKYTRQIKNLLLSQLEDPSDDFVKFVANGVFEGVLSQTRREYFKGLAKKGFKQMINDEINERLQSAMSGDEQLKSPVKTEDGESDAVSVEEKTSAVVTTEEELEGFFIVKALLRGRVEPSRIVHRDTQTYMGILLDDNNRKPLARLWFNTSQKYLGVFDENRNETKIPISALDDIYQHSELLTKVFDFYESSE